MFVPNFCVRCHQSVCLCVSGVTVGMGGILRLEVTITAVSRSEFTFPTDPSTGLPSGYLGISDNSKDAKRRLTLCQYALHTVAQNDGCSLHIQAVERGCRSNSRESVPIGSLHKVDHLQRTVSTRQTCRPHNLNHT